MGKPIDRLSIEGYKSIRSLQDFELRPLNILIGPNGAGKSNFVSFFEMLRQMVEQRLQLFVQKHGGADAHLYLGPKITKRIVGHLYFALGGYEFILEPTADGKLVFAAEQMYVAEPPEGPIRLSLGSGHDETKIREASEKAWKDPTPTGIYSAISSWMVYHFHDTSDTAGVKRRCSIRDNEYLRHDASNLSAFLFSLQKKAPNSYMAIRDAVRLVAPFFDDFKLRPVEEGSDEIELEWRQVNSDFPFHASQLSDGTLRFICLAATLLQPNPPSTILLDEPELGMHPYALTLLASLLKQASDLTQVIVSTQSAPLLNSFEPEDVVVVEREGSESVFRRLDRASVDEWLKDYSLGDLWQKNVIGGRPTNG